MGYVDKATQALIKRGKYIGFIYFNGGKIADITHADTSEHVLTKSALGLPENAIALLCKFARVSGTGVFKIRTVAAGSTILVSTPDSAVWPEDDAGEFRYELGTSGDDWDVNLFGYWTQGIVYG